MDATNPSESGENAVELADEDVAVQTQTGTDVTVASELESNAGGGETVEVFVRFDAATSENFATATDGAAPTGDSKVALKREAELAQAGFDKLAADSDAVSVINDFWITNAKLVEVDTSQVSLDSLTTVDGVTALHPNYAVEQVDPEPVQTDAVEPADHGVSTYGLQQVNAPAAWEAFDATGQGVDVAVIDTGIHADHQEFDDYNESNWAAFDFEGNQRDVGPHDDNGHGTHVAGTILGGNESGVHIGVAPDANLYAINVFPDPNGGTTLAAIVAGMQHAVEEDTDLISMSLGGGGYAGVYVDVVQNAQAAGTHVVASSGNDGPNAEGTPGNVYNVTAVGATDATGAVAGFSTGTEINTSEEWGFIAPESWPDEYVTPDVAAPGVDVYSSVPGGTDTYSGAYSGTSMAAPHVSGVMALVLSAQEQDPTPNELKDTIEETATKPAPDALSPAVLDQAGQISQAQIVNLHDDTVADARYGYGIVDAYSAITALNASSNQLTVDVQDPDGNPVVDSGQLVNDGTAASVTLDDASRTEYAADGTATFDVAKDTVEVTAADAFGYVSNNATVTLSGDTTETIQLDRRVDLQALQPLPSELNATDGATLSADVAHLENYTVSLGPNADVAEENVTLTLSAGTYGPTEIQLGQTIDVTEQTPNGQTGEFALNVTVDGAVGEVVELEHTFEGHNESATVSVGSTELVEDAGALADLQISEHDPLTEALPGSQMRTNDITVHNPADEAQNGTVVWNLEPLGAFTESVSLGPGESETFNISLHLGTVPAPWSYEYGVGDTAQQALILEDERGNVDDTDVWGTEIVGGDLSGQVTDTDGEALGGITVTATDGFNTVETTTNSSGHYQLVAPAPGEWTVTAQSGSYGPATSTVTIDQNMTPVTHDVAVGSTPTFDLQMAADESFALGIPADVKGGTVGDVVETDAAKIWAFDTETDGWSLVNSSYEIGALDAIVVSTNARTNVSITFAGTPGEDGMATPGSKPIDEGWNFVAPAEFDTPSDAFTSSASIESVMGIQEPAQSPMLPDGGFQGVETMNTADNVSPFGGYFVFAADDGELGANTYEGMTLDSAYANLGVSTSAIEGQVTSAVTDDPIEGATVSIAGTTLSATTDETGQYTLPSVPNTLDQDLVVDAPDYDRTTVADASGPTDVTLQDEVYFNVTDFTLTSGTDYEIGNSTVELSYTIRNDGSQTAQQVVSSEFGVDVENARINESTWQLNATMFTLDPGESITVSVTEPVGEFVTTDASHVGVFTADDHEIREVTVTE
ncbi:S8 family serine peptidase [Halovivax cerinus]|uniref:S8 family serine peptidase n=1 Tax=Halovivax cerinus TaxID=1487865 RepID=A0ABD5NRT0_9EURY|nr:S8 family serine peptidase [Halovivax cerinus]